MHCGAGWGGAGRGGTVHSGVRRGGPARGGATRIIVARASSIRPSSSRLTTSHSFAIESGMDAQQTFGAMKQGVDASKALQAELDVDKVADTVGPFLCE